MKIQEIKQISEDAIETLSFDIIITTSGYEKRAVHLITKYKVESPIKLTFSFKNHDRILSRQSNDLAFRDRKFKIFPIEVDGDKSIIQILTEFISRVDSKEINILVDYSCMTRTWYAAILAYFKFVNNDLKTVHLYFSYSMASFTPAPEDSSKNLDVSPIKGYNNISVPYLPTALIIGLGYIEQRALGLAEYLDAVPFVFYTDSSKNNLFTSEVEKNNKMLLSKISSKNTYTYPINDLDYSFHILRDLCKDLKSEYRLVLAPCGPKPFSLLCFLTSLVLEDIDVWRVSAGESAQPIDKTPEGRILVLKVSFA